jgi:hypothetical protein
LSEELPIMSDVPAPDHLANSERFSHAFWFLLDSLHFVWRWISRFPVAGATAGLVVAVVVFDAGRGLGLPALFWEQEPLKTFSTGAALAVLFALVCFVGFLLESKRGPIANRHLTLRAYAARTYLVLFVLLAVGAWKHRLNDNGTNVLLLLAGHIGGAVTVYLAAMAIEPWAKRRPLDTPLLRWLQRYFDEPAPEEYRWLHYMAAMLFGALFVIYALLALTLPPLPAAVAICILAGVILQVYGAIRYWSRAAFVTFALLLVVSGVLNVNLGKYRHRYPDLASSRWRFRDRDRKESVLLRAMRLMRSSLSLRAWRAGSSDPSRCRAAPPRGNRIVVERA